MEIEEQKSLAFSLLEQLNEWRPTILAGGAPRDWDYGEKANDLDFFVLEDFDPVEVEGNLNVELEAVGGERYDDSSFKVFSFHVGEQEVQIIHHVGSPTAQDVINKLGCSLSKIWYERGGVLHKDSWYTLTRDFRVGLLDMEAGERFIDKSSDMFFNKGIRIATTRAAALSVIGRGITTGE